MFDLVRRAGCQHPAKSGPPSSQPGHGGMWACRPTRFDGGAAGIGGLLGRLLAARTAPPEPPGLRTTPPRSWRHVGMPPYSVRRECGGNRGPARAAASRPYGACSTWSVGRGAHTPPNPARRHRNSPPFPLVGAASSRPDWVLIRAGVQWFRPAWGRASRVRTAPPEPPGLLPSRPGHGGMWACRPTVFDGGAAKSAGLLGRLLAAPTAHVRPGP